MAFCSNCGNQLEGESKYCRSCGARQASVGMRAVGSAHRTNVKPKSRVLLGILFVLVAIAVTLLIGGTHQNEKSDVAAAGSTATAHPTAHYAVNQTVHVGYWSYAVWNTKWQSSIGSDYMAEYPDAKFLVVRMTVRNNDKSSSTLPPMKLVDSQGREYDSTSKGSFSEGFFGPLKTVNPGVESSGSVAFDVPRGDYSLKVSGGFTSGEVALIDLHSSLP